MTKAALLFALLLVASSAHAQDPRIPQGSNTRGTAEDQRACGSDARKFCRGVIQDDFAVLRCFQQNRPKLSRACRAVLEKYGQ